MMKLVLPIVLVTLMAMAPQDTRGYSEADARKAELALASNADDPEANLTMAKHIAFAKDEWDKALPYFSKGSDSTLKALAEHELDPSYTAASAQKITMGDEWVSAAKKLPALSRFLLDRASQWYIRGWLGLDVGAKEKVRLKGRRISVSRPIGVPRKGIPSTWQADVGLAGRPPAIEGAVAHTGSYSIRIPAADEKVQNSVSALVSDLLPVTGRTFELSSYILADGTENAGDKIGLRFFDSNGAMMGTPAFTFTPVDLPFWNRILLKGNVPENAARAQIVIALYSKNGGFWVDDVSLKIDGKELLKNGGFEDK